MNATSSTFAGTQLASRPSLARPAARRTAVRPAALFKKKAPVVVEEPPAPPAKKGIFDFATKKKTPVKKEAPPPPPAKKGLFNFGGKKAAPAKKEAPPPPPPKKGLFAFGGKKAAAPAKEAPKKKTAPSRGSVRFDRTLGQLNNEARNTARSDAQLLAEARGGKFGSGDKMSPEQYAALRRKIGGTARGYFKDFVDVKGEYTDKGWVSEESSEVSYAPFLIAVVAALLATTAYVVTQV